MVAQSRHGLEDVRLWSALFLLCNQTSQIVERKLMRVHALGLSDFMVLLEIKESQGGGVRMLDIAHRIGVQQSTLSRIADRLERNGLVERRTNDADRRGTNLTLTQRGRKDIASFRATFADELNVAFEMAALEPELADLMTRLRSEGEKSVSDSSRS